MRSHNNLLLFINQHSLDHSRFPYTFFFCLKYQACISFFLFFAQSLSLSKVRYQLIIRSRDSPCTRVLRVPSTMASTLSLVILQAIVLVVSSTDRETRVNESFHGRVSQIGTRKIIWPHLFRERWARVQEREHDWNRLWNYKNDDDVETTIATAPTIGSSMRPIVRSNATRPDKFGAIAVAEYAGTRAIAYAGFHEDHRHRALSEATTRGYQRILTTTPTYTRHHSGYVPGISFLTITLTINFLYFSFFIFFFY